MKIKRFFKATRMISRVLFFIWVGYLALFSIIYLSEDIYSGYDFAGVIVGTSAFFLIPAILVEYKKNPIISEKIGKKIKPILAHTIWGVILIEFAPFICMGSIIGANNSEKTEWVPLLVSLFLGIAFFVFGILLVNGYVTKLKTTAASCKQQEIETNKVKVNIDYSNNFHEKNVESNDKNIYQKVKVVAKKEPTRKEISMTYGMEGHQFEYFCADILKRTNFGNVSVTPGSGDQGVDILAEKNGIKYAIQCKSYASPLSNKPVQEVNAGKMYYNCHVGVVMTNSIFTPGAEALARATNVLLWDKSVVQEMMDQAYLTK